MSAIDDPVFNYCAGELRRGDRDRYLTAVLAPPETRRRLLALYAFNLELAKAAEVTSEPMLAEIRLTWWHEAVSEVYGGKPRQHMVVRALVEAGLPEIIAEAELQHQIDVRLEDLQPERFDDLEQLAAFAADGAGRMVMTALACLGPAEGPLSLAARDIGAAWALVGLMRGLARHASQRRLYLPKEALARAGVTADEVYAGRRAEALAPLVGQVLETAMTHLDAARAICPRPPRWSLPVLLLAPLARAYARRLRHQGSDPFAGSVSLGHLRPPLLLAWHNWRGKF
jgi:NADH dehydrogenase [ubiquinone] 1 alpha subcomplex assembly factor 6